jgi:hypothetical protein
MFNTIKLRAHQRTVNRARAKAGSSDLIPLTPLELPIWLVANRKTITRVTLAIVAAAALVAGSLEFSRMRDKLYIEAYESTKTESHR